jgi:hypothetical protein
MSEQQASQQGPGDRVVNERCVCREVVDRLQDLFGVSPAVREHLSNSRIELLKAVRAVIDDRIERLSGTGRQGAKISVE